ncbi:MAG: 3'-5' exonuclease domain-containing protein 2 [Desulfobacteraceae bacterium]|nr:3'-5' exonuclease domain-containing protein 2 [Desulfobacteraceae bacterium]
MSMKAAVHRPELHQRLTKDEINACPLVRWSGPVQVVSTAEALAAAAEHLAAERLLGFDTETRPSFRKGESHPPALLQLACESVVFIFQLHRIGLPASLRALLADPAILKAGVAPARDLRELQQLAFFEPAGFVDLARMAKEAGFQNHGLRGLAAALLGCRIAKGARTSNWAQATLNPAQIGYAATDAWLGRELYRRLLQLPAIHSSR